MKSRLWKAIATIALCVAGRQVCASDEEARVLILNGLDPYLPAYLEIDAAMRARLAEESGRRIVFFSEPLDAQRFAIEAMEPEFVALLAKKYRALRIDVVVAVSLPSLEFFKRHSEQLWPGARFVFQGFPGESIEAADLPPNGTGVVTRQDVRQTIALARRMQPAARHVVIVAGASALDTRVEQQARTMLSPSTEYGPVEFVSGLPLPELVTRVAAEPVNTIIVYLSQFRDRDGRPYTPREVLREISKASIAPVYGASETYFGFGAVAGNVESYEAKGQLVAEQILAALRDAPPDPSRILLETPSRCVADARLLQRWSLDASRLPEGCVIRFAEHSYAREHPLQILAVLGIVAAQTALIAALLIQRRRRRVAESESRKRYVEMAHLSRRVALGEISASIAHELNQPLGAIRNNAGAAEILIKADPPRLHEIAEILSDIRRDDQRASDIIGRFGKMLRKSEFEIQALDLNEPIEETVKLLATEASEKGVSIEYEPSARLPKVRADRVELQQVLMNLLLNAIESVQSAPLRKVAIDCAARNPDEVEVSVADSGGGIPSDVLPRIFDAFVSSKKTGMGLGLAISRTIIEAHGGRIHAENAPDGGAIVRFTLLCAKDQIA